MSIGIRREVMRDVFIFAICVVFLVTVGCENVIAYFLLEREKYGLLMEMVACQSS